MSTTALSDKSALVLELGGRYVRCGISGERAPRCVTRWEVRRPAVRYGQ